MYLLPDTAQLTEVAAVSDSHKKDKSRSIKSGDLAFYTNTVNETGLTTYRNGLVTITHEHLKSSYSSAIWISGVSICRNGFTLTETLTE